MNCRSIVVMMLFFCQGCAPTVSKERAAVDSFMEDFAKKQKCENGLSLCGSGHALQKGRVKKLTLYFLVHRNLHVEEARHLYIDVTQQMLKQINSDDALRICLDHYPFTTDDVHVSFLLKDPSGRNAEPPYLAFVFMANGVIHYAYYDAINHIFFKEDLVESYAEALHMYNESGHCSCSSKS